MAEQFNLEIRHGTPTGDFRTTHSIQRPDGFNDEEYTAHASAAAELVAKVLTGRPGSLLNVTGVVMGVLEAGSLSESEITDGLSAAADLFNAAQTWREAHVVELAVPVAI